MKKRFKFLREGMRSEKGKCTWEINEWKKHDGSIIMCDSGFHCSKEIGQAFGYVQGEILAEVEVRGESLVIDDKEVYSEMRVVRAWKWQKKDSVALSIFAAELCLQDYEKEHPDDKRPRDAIEAAKDWLKNPTEENQSAAWSAARSAESAARSAAWSAAWSAARSAARSAESAAGSAARSAAWSAARSAARSAESAAGSAARSAESAARSAAWSAESAAWSAAGSAARSAESAAIKKIYKWFDKHLSELEGIRK